MNNVLGAWIYESDGEVGSRTHYAVRDAATLIGSLLTPRPNKRISRP